MFAYTTLQHFSIPNSTAYSLIHNSAVCMHTQLYSMLTNTTLQHVCIHNSTANSQIHYSKMQMKNWFCSEHSIKNLSLVILFVKWWDRFDALPLVCCYRLEMNAAPSFWLHLIPESTVDSISSTPSVHYWGHELRPPCCLATSSSFWHCPQGHGFSGSGPPGFVQYFEMLVISKIE